MTETFDAVVIGAGVVGAATAFHLAKLGGLKVCVVDRGPVCGGGTAKSCAIVRSHYSVPSNTALTLRGLRTARGEIHAGLVISAIGPWTRSVTDSIGLDIPLEVSRHIVLTFGTGAP